MIPLHPSVVHFPLVLSLLLPILILAFAFMIRMNKMSYHAWFIIMGLQLATVASGYIAMETGETDEQLVKQVVDKNLIHAHEEAAKIFVGFAVLALVTSIGVFFIRKDLQFRVQMLIMLISLIAAGLGWRTGRSGGELVYLHGAGGAHQLSLPESSGSGLLPTPGQNTSESPFPMDENESLKVDDHDYGNEPASEDEFQPEE
jgi:uncharacterized membrane protein